LPRPPGRFCCQGTGMEGGLWVGRKGRTEAVPARKPGTGPPGAWSAAGRRSVLGSNARRFWRAARSRRGADGSGRGAASAPRTAPGSAVLRSRGKGSSATEARGAPEAAPGDERPPPGRKSPIRPFLLVGRRLSGAFAFLGEEDGERRYFGISGQEVDCGIVDRGERGRNRGFRVGSGTRTAFAVRDRRRGAASFGVACRSDGRASETKEDDSTRPDRNNRLRVEGGKNGGFFGGLVALPGRGSMEPHVMWLLVPAAWGTIHPVGRHPVVSIQKDQGASMGLGLGLRTCRDGEGQECPRRQS